MLEKETLLVGPLVQQVNLAIREAREKIIWTGGKRHYVTLCLRMVPKIFYASQALKVVRAVPLDIALL